MNPKFLIGTIIVLLVLGAAGAVLWLANSDMMPPTHTVEQSIPDDQIPH